MTQEAKAEKVTQVPGMSEREKVNCITLHNLCRKSKALDNIIIGRVP